MGQQSTNIDLDRFLALIRKQYADLTDEELAELLVSQGVFKSFLYDLWRSYPSDYETLYRYRTRKAELAKKSTEELQAMAQSISAERSAILEADVNDDLDDSFFGAPRIDSDRYVVRELLLERRRAPTTA